MRAQHTSRPAYLIRIKSHIQIPYTWAPGEETGSLWPTGGDLQHPTFALSVRGLGAGEKDKGEEGKDGL